VPSWQWRSFNQIHGRAKLKERKKINVLAVSLLLQDKSEIHGIFFQTIQLLAKILGRKKIHCVSVLSCCNWRELQVSCSINSAPGAARQLNLQASAYGNPLDIQDDVR
jgi:hypothetical protein